MTLGVSNKAHWLPRTLRFWAAFAVITLIVMLTHESDTPVVLHRYSYPVFMSLLGLTIGIITSIALANASRTSERIERQLETWRMKSWFMPLVLIVAAGLLITMWFFFLGDHLETYRVLRLFLGFTILLVALIVLTAGDVSETRINIRNIILPLIAVSFIAAVLVSNFYPVLHRDETLILGMVRNFADTGNAGPTLYRFTMPTNYIARGLWIWFMSGWLKLTGFSLMSARFYSLLLGYLALPFIWGTAARLYNRTVAWLAVLLAAFAIAPVGYSRTDTSTILLFSLALYCYVLARSNSRWWLHLLTGLFVSLAVDSELIAFVFGLGFFVNYLLQYIKQRRVTRKWIWWPIIFLIIGGLLGTAFYGVTRAGTTFLKGGYNSMSRDTSANTGESAEPASVAISYLADGLQRIKDGSFIIEAETVLSTFISSQRFLLGLLICGLLVAFYEHQESDRFLLIMFGVWLGIIVFTYFYFPPFYTVHVLPITSILMARGLEGVATRLLGSQFSVQSRYVIVATLLLCVWFAAIYFKDVATASGNHFPEQIEISNQISKMIPQETVIVGASPYFVGMLNNRGFVAAETERAMIDYLQLPTDSVWSTIKPNAIVFSTEWPTLPAPSNPLLRDYMTEHTFSMIHCWQTANNVHVELWMDKIPGGVSPDSTCTTVG